MANGNIDILAFFAIARTRSCMRPAAKCGMTRSAWSRGLGVTAVAHHAD